MRKIDKTTDKILSTKYKSWIGKIIKNSKKSSGNSYYDDVAMNLYYCQGGVCAYTEMFICIPELYDLGNWKNGRYKISNEKDYSRLDHLGEMDHFDPENKKIQYWNWDNLFMIHAKINGIKSNEPVLNYLKPDLDDYSPDKYFDYDEETHRFIPNTDIKDETKLKKIQTMIDKVFCLNHGVVKNERRDFIKSLKDKKSKGQEYIIDRFFTATNLCLTE